MQSFTFNQCRTSRGGQKKVKPEDAKFLAKHDWTRKPQNIPLWNDLLTLFWGGLTQTLPAKHRLGHFHVFPCVAVLQHWGGCENIFCIPSQWGWKASLGWTHSFIKVTFNTFLPYQHCQEQAVYYSHTFTLNQHCGWKQWRRLQNTTWLNVKRFSTWRNWLMQGRENIFPSVWLLALTVLSATSQLVTTLHYDQV